MPERIARKRLKKKMLDRWENEGGRVAADDTGVVEDNRPTSEGSDKQRSASRKSTSVSPTKKRKSTAK